MIPAEKHVGVAEEAMRRGDSSALLKSFAAEEVERAITRVLERG